MTETSSQSLPSGRWRIPGPEAPDTPPENRFALSALERHKREGLELAVRARTIAMLVIAVMVSCLTPWPEALYYVALTGLFILIGFAQRRVGRVGASGTELALLFCDLLLMTIVAAAPNPFSGAEFPLPFQYQFEIHRYFFVILVTATLAYSWRTLIAIGTWTTALWLIAAFLIWHFADNDLSLRADVQALYPDNVLLQEFMDPTRIIWDQRIQEVVVFLMCAVILGISMRRFTNLLLAQASAERERANLARYFSPNVVEQLSHNDEPLKQVRTQDIAVLFVDLVGFTAFSAARHPADVIATLREFHALMEAEVFRHHGTLDKYLGDGLMATFGTPVAGPGDALNALMCARAMTGAVDRWNAARVAAGEPEIRASFGLHYGPAVLGDIGANRLEFAVIGNTVNVASRLEALTRDMSVRLIASDALRARICDEAGEQAPAPLVDLLRHDDCAIRGVRDPMTIWAMR